MFSTIVVGTDGSKDAEQALAAAAEFAALVENPEIHIVTAYRPLSVSDIKKISADLPEELQPLLHGHIGAETTLAEARATLATRDLEAKYHELDDHPTDAILEVADRYGADLIIVGSKGEGPAGRMLHGSVSTKVFHHASCAVLVVKAKGQPV